nr:MAG TPA: hypothetical protein [Caudoviricetes sp.]
MVSRRNRNSSVIGLAGIFSTFRTCLFERATLLPGVVLSFFILKAIQETNNVLL